MDLSLIRPHEGAEHPVHYVSKALQDVEVRYPDIEKLAFALVVLARCPRPYFQPHTIHVLTNQPQRQVSQKLETSGRLVKWPLNLVSLISITNPAQLQRARPLLTSYQNSRNP
ncbi:unnamed protein product [Prunus armeniaca]